MHSKLHFYARQLCFARLSHGLGVSLSVLLSVCLSMCLSHLWAVSNKSRVKSQNLYCVLPKASSFQQQNFVPRGEGVPFERGRQKEVALEKNVILLLLARLVWKRLQIGRNKLLDVLFSFINIDDLERLWTPIKVLSKFLFAFLAAAQTVKVCCNEMAGDRPKQTACEIFSIKQILVV